MRLCQFPDGRVGGVSADGLTDARARCRGPGPVQTCMYNINCFKLKFVEQPGCMWRQYCDPYKVIYALPYMKSALLLSWVQGLVWGHHQAAIIWSGLVGGRGCWAQTHKEEGTTLLPGDMGSIIGVSIGRRGRQEEGQHYYRVTGVASLGWAQGDHHTDLEWGAFVLVLFFTRTLHHEVTALLHKK